MQTVSSRRVEKHRFFLRKRIRRKIKIAGVLHRTFLESSAVSVLREIMLRSEITVIRPIDSPWFRK